jgi:PKHD-type hydroxylase
MLLIVENVLTKDQVTHCRDVMARQAWVDGRIAAEGSPGGKHNRQLPEDLPAARQMGDLILDALGDNPLFQSAALPFSIFPPLFTLHAGNDEHGASVGDAIRAANGSAFRLRADIAATLFLSEPEEYEGGELTIEDSFSAEAVKLPAGDLILSSASSRHHVGGVTHGARICSSFWIQSLIRDEGERALLYDLDQTILSLAVQNDGETPEIVSLKGLYENLIRRWADS